MIKILSLYHVHSFVHPYVRSLTFAAKIVVVASTAAVTAASNELQAMQQSTLQERGTKSHIRKLYNEF